MSSKIVPLKKILESSFDKVKSKRYLKGIDLKSNDTVYLKPSELYQDALKKLLDGETEKAINYIVFALDIDRKDNLILHLTKVMLYSLSKFLKDNNADIYRQKYANNIDEAESIIKKKVKSIENRINYLKKESQLLDNIIENNSKSIIFRIFKKKKMEREKDNYLNEVYTSMDSIDKLKNDLKNIQKITKVDEYVRVLSIIVEACIFPSRFEWIHSEK